MLLNSFTFLVFFLVIVVLYYTIPNRWRWVLLLVASYYFYSTYDPRYVLMLLFATGVAYAAGMAIGACQTASQAKTIMTIGVVVQLSVLGVFKYFNFFVDSFEMVFSDFHWISESVAMPRMEFLLPAGLSFYTFSCISYIVDVYRNTISAERHFGRLAVYVAFFPKLLAGPIERASPFLSQISGRIQFDRKMVAFGLQLLLWGLIKKVVIADRLAEYVDAGFTNPEFQSPVVLLIAVYLYAFQIYCDFSGYSDMAIGAAAILGIRLMDNFKRPYLSRSVPEFWGQRWHISLMSWLRDYLYIPLGGSRVSKFRWYTNLMIVFLLSGLWHGAALTFIVWGALNGLYQILYFMLSGIREWAARVLPGWLWDGLSLLLTFHLILIAWVFFRASSLTEAWVVLSRVAGAIPQYPQLLLNYNWHSGIWFSFVLILILIVVEAMDEVRSMWDRLAERSVAVRWGVYYFLISTLLVIGYWDMEDFVYMQF